jgi:predicted ATP-dependent serine protease
MFPITGLSGIVTLNSLETIIVPDDTQSMHVDRCHLSLDSQIKSRSIFFTQKSKALHDNLLGVCHVWKAGAVTEPTGVHPS